MRDYIEGERGRGDGGVDWVGKGTKARIGYAASVTSGTIDALDTCPHRPDERAIDLPELTENIDPATLAAMREYEDTMTIRRASE
ncbi:MAG TPA: hypothetical protein VMR28_01965 [Candidatus Saccharimonadales bacterium]|nr:hypothetical protein [Candidatus Saccharimonadales bacterium]